VFARKVKQTHFHLLCRSPTAMLTSNICLISSVSDCKHYALDVSFAYSILLTRLFPALTDFLPFLSGHDLIRGGYFMTQTQTESTVTAIGTSRCKSWSTVTPIWSSDHPCETFFVDLVLCAGACLIHLSNLDLFVVWDSI